MRRFSALLMICHGFFIQKYNECKSSPGCAEDYLVRSISRQTIRLYHNHFPTYTNERRLLHSYEKRYGQSIPKEWGSPNEKERKNITNSDSHVEYTTRLFTRSIHRARIGDFLPYKSMVGSNLGYQFRLHTSRERVLIKGKLKKYYIWQWKRICRSQNDAIRTQEKRWHTSRYLLCLSLRFLGKMKQWKY